MDKLEIRNLKGTMDFLPREQKLKNDIIDVLKANFETYGYLPLETPTLCYYDLLSSKYAGGAEILKEVYTLKDQGNRDIGLRYDLTVPFSKVIALYLNKELTLPFRRYEIGKVFRDGPVKLGRNREFYQCDVDLCGLSGTMPEIELLQMAIKCYKDLNIDIKIEWNNRKLLTGFIIESGIPEEIASRVILSVDKLAKIGEDGVRDELEDLAIDNNSLNKLFTYFKLSLNDIAKVDAGNEILKEGIKEVLETNSYIEKLNLEECVFTPYLARGLEIYTGTIWEVFDKQGRITSSIGAGGRYDKIITNFINDGNEYPAVGMTFGLAPIYEILKKDQKTDFYDLYIIPMDTNVEALKLASSLRDKGIRTIIEMNNRKLKKALEWANKNNVPYVIILGNDEIENKVIKLKDMNNAKEIVINIDDTLEIVKNIRK